MTRATVEDSTGLGQPFRAERPLVGGFYASGLWNAAHGLNRTVPLTAAASIPTVQMRWKEASMVRHALAQARAWST